MTVGILTHYKVINQGTILQMYALQKWLSDVGCDVRILTYAKSYDFAPSEAGKYNISLRYVPFYIKNYLIKKGVKLTIFNIRKQFEMNKFIAHNFVFSHYADSQCDIAIIGSDEVFSLEVGCNMMMYGHGVNCKRLVSYAPSFGQTSMQRIEKYSCRELIQSGLRKFYAISVRDNSSANIVEELLGTQPQIVCDPVILYDFSNISSSVKTIGAKYLLIYSYERWMIDENEIKGIKEYARRKQLLIVSAGTHHKWCDNNIVCDPLEWLEYFRNAEEVITDTFHGSILGIITHRRTCFYIRDLNQNKLSSLLDSMGLSHRIAKHLTCDEIERIQRMDMDLDVVDHRLREIRAQSSEFLKKAIGV